MDGFIGVRECEEGGQDNDFQAFSVVDVESNESSRKRSEIEFLKNSCIPIQIVVQDLDSDRLQPPCWLFCDGNNNR